MVIHADGTRSSRIDTAPSNGSREHGDKRIPKTKRVGKRLTKLAAMGCGIIRTDAEHNAHTRMAMAEVPKLEAARKSLRSGTERDAISHKLAELCVPTFGVRIAIEETASVTYWVSADVLIDWRREYGKRLETVALPVLPRHGMRGLRITEAHNATVEQAATARANMSGIGLAQNAWRYAHLEGDSFIEAVAFYWLWHGTTKPCRDNECEHCVYGRARRDPFTDLGRQHAEIIELATFYFDEVDVNGGKPQQPKRMPHRMPQPSETDLAFAFRTGYRVV